MTYLTSPCVDESADDGQDFVFAQDQVLFAVDLDVRPGVLAEEDLVAGLDVERQLGAVLEDLAVAHRDDLALLGLLLRGVGDDDPPLDGLFLLDSLYDQAVVKRTNLHREASPFNTLSCSVACKTLDWKRFRAPEGFSGGVQGPSLPTIWKNIRRALALCQGECQGSPTPRGCTPRSSSRACSGGS